MSTPVARPHKRFSVTGMAQLRVSPTKRVRAPSCVLRSITAAIIVLVGSMMPGREASAQLPAAQLHALFPPGGRQGTIVEVRIASGRDTDGAARLVFSHPHITAVQKTRSPSAFEEGPQPVAGEFTAAIHPDVPPGMYEARCVGRFGMSNPRAFVVGNIPEQNEAADNHAADKAATVALDTIVNGTADAAAGDFFKIALKKDQRIVLDCWADRIDSQMDATLAIYDAAGRELAADRDTNRRDPLLVFTAPSDGDYIVKLYDFLYRGGGEYPYRLQISTGPYVDFVFPPVAMPGSKAGFTVFGSNLPGGSKVEGLALRGRPFEQASVEIEAPAGEHAGDLALNGLLSAHDATLDGFEYRLGSPPHASNPILIGFTSAPVVFEQEPNDDAAKPQPVTVPCTFVGRFAPRGDYDWLSFEAKKGDTYWIEAISQRLGLPTDPYVLIQRITRNDKGEVQTTDVQEIDDMGRGAGLPSFRPESADPAYRFAASEDGTYRVLIRDLYANSRGDPRYVYALAIRRAAPDFRLVAVPAHHYNAAGPAESAPSNPLLRRGGTETIDVVALRRDDFGGAIEIGVEGLPAGVTAGKATIEAGQGTATVVLRAADDAAAFAGPIRVTGKAIINGQETVRVARPATVRFPVINNQTADARLARDLWLSVLSIEDAPLLADFGEAKTWEMSLAGKIEIPVKLIRRGEMKQPVTLTPLGLPANVKAQAITINPDAAEGKIAIEIGRKAQPGLHCLRLQAQANLPYRRDPQSAEAAVAVRARVEKIASVVAEQFRSAEQARQAAEKTAADADAVSKQSAEAAQAEAQRASAAAAALKSATEKAVLAREAAEKDATNEELTQAKDAAEKAAAEAQSQAQSAAAAQDVAEKAAAEAAAGAQTAAAEKAAKGKLAVEAATKNKAAEEAKAAAEKRATEAAKAAEPKNITVFESSTSALLMIAAAPLTLHVTEPAALLPGAQADVPFKVARLYGFAEPIEIELIVPEAVKGLSAAKLSLPADQSEAVLALAAAADATTGKHNLTARTKFKFGGEDFQVDQPFAVTIETAK